MSKGRSVGDATFLRHCSRCVHVACRAGHEPPHVIDHRCNLWFQAFPASLDHFSYHEIFPFGGSKGVKIDGVDKDYLPWLAMRLRAMSIREMDSNSSLVADLYIDVNMFYIFPRGNYFHDTGACPTYLLFACFQHSVQNVLQMLNLRQRLGVAIHYLIGSDMEPLRLGCSDFTKVHPKVTKPCFCSFSNSKGGQENIFLRNIYIIFWCNEVVCILRWVDFVYTNVRMPGLSRLSCHGAQAPSLTSSPSVTLH